MKVDVEAVASFDYTAILATLGDVAEVILTKGADDMRKYAENKWVGWRYQGQYLPQAGKRHKRVKPPGTSLEAWQVEKVQGTEGVRTIALVNRARDPFYGNAYAGFVHRSGSGIEEWKVVWAGIESTIVPKIAQDLAFAVAHELPGNKSRKVNVNKGGYGTDIRKVEF